MTEPNARTISFPLRCTHALNVTVVPEGGPGVGPEPHAWPLVWVEAAPAGSDSVRCLTGRSGGTAMIFERKDGADRLVCFLTPEDVAAIQRVIGP